MGKKKLMSSSEAAQFIGVSKPVLYGWCRSSQIPHLKIGTQYRFFEDTLTAWLAEQSRKGAQL